MKVAFDCCYDNNNRCAVTAVVFRDWTDMEPVCTISRIVDNVPPYEPGAFYKRELLPLIIAYNEVVAVYGKPEVLIVDGFVDIGDPTRLPNGPPKPGLGRKLHEATGVPVIGVAKNEFIGAPSHSILRGNSQNELFISTADFRLADAALFIYWMHGPFRIPTLLKLADSECRRVLREHA